MMPLTKTEPKQNPQPYIRQSKKNEESEWPKKRREKKHANTFPNKLKPQEAENKLTRRPEPKHTR
jgi:hypothetical protein